MPYHEFSQDQTTIEPRFIIGGFMLTLLAGMINASMLSYFSVPVSHMSGAIARAGIDIGSLKFQDLGTISCIILGFIAGAVLSGCVMGTNIFRHDRKYTCLLGIEAVVLVLAAFCLHRWVGASVTLCALACGLQNAMASSYRGLVVRTTHMTGIVTDLGFMIGSSLSGKTHGGGRYLLLIALLSGYFTGAMVAVIGLHVMTTSIIFVCSALALIIAIGNAYLMPGNKQA